MALSDVKTDGSWIKTYDEKGKHISITRVSLRAEHEQ